MTVNEANEILKGVKFLNHKFEMESEVLLKISFVAPDSRDRNKIFRLAHRRTLYIAELKPKDFITAVFNALAETLKHEAAELFSVWGQDVFNPHLSRDQKETKWTCLNEMLTPEHLVIAE